MLEVMFPPGGAADRERTPEAPPTSHCSLRVAGKCSYPIILLTISNYLAVKAAGDKFPPRPAWRYHQPDMSFM